MCTCHNQRWIPVSFYFTELMVMGTTSASWKVVQILNLYLPVQRYNKSFLSYKQFLLTLMCSNPVFSKFSKCNYIWFWVQPLSWIGTDQVDWNLHPDFGDGVPIKDDEIPIFWASLPPHPHTPRPPPQPPLHSYTLPTHTLHTAPCHGRSRAP